ncbi:hypothetical protein HY495_02140 [Candidatus Woesearchaeota archaeon]|nr:hypothetical protein [Candidatus Woesearchaeota archaeon]
MKKIIKKSIQALILALFILSVVPMAFAQEDLKVNGKGAVNAKIALLEADAEADAAVRAEDKVGDNEADTQTAEDQRKDRQETFKEQRKALGERLRAEKEVTQEQIEQLRERLRTAKEGYEQARERYQEQKENLKELRDRYKICRDGDGSEECVDVRKKATVGVQKHLEKTIDLIENSLARLTAHVRESTTLTDAEKESALASINKLQEKVDAQKEKVLAIAETATAEELRAEVKELKELWQDVSKQQKRIVSQLTSAKLDNLVDRYTGLSENMAEKIAALKEKGVDTTELEDIAYIFEAAAATLQEDQQKARLFWQEAEDMSRETLQQWHAAQEVVKEDMKKTRALLREFTSLYAELNVAAETAAEADAESEDAAESATEEE